MRIYRIAAQSDQDFWLQLEQHQDESDRAILEKPIRLYNRKLKVANVGGLQTMFDTSRSAWVARWLLKNDPDLQEARDSFANKREIYIFDKKLVKECFQEDDIDLNFNRDFLKENIKYDIVILQHIYNGSGEDQYGEFRKSDYHSRENWIKRLITTNARYIFAFGGWTEVGGVFLQDIPGYTWNDSGDSDITIYSK